MSIAITKGATVKVGLTILLAGTVAVWGASAVWNDLKRDVAETKKEQEKHPSYEKTHNTLSDGIQHLMTLQEAELRYRRIRIPRRPKNLRKKGK